MGDGDAVLRKEIDLLGVDGHAVDGHQAIAQETGTGERTDPGRAGGRNEQRGVGGDRARTPSPPTDSRSAELSARCVAIGSSSPRQAAYSAVDAV